MIKKTEACSVVALLLLLCAGGAVFSAGCTEQNTPPRQDPFQGGWLYGGKIGDVNATIMFTFLENKTGRFDLAVTDAIPPYIQSMEFSWHSEGDRLFIGSGAEGQHLDIRYDGDHDRMIVKADETSGIFIGSDFVPGPFTWVFTRMVK